MRRPSSPRPLHLAAALSLGVASALMACDDPCAELSEICDTCVDPNQKAACQLVAEAPDAERSACVTALNDGRFDIECPGP